MNNRYYSRIDKIEDINTLSRLVCKEYKLGNLVNTFVIEIGYEDFNAVIITNLGKYFMKVFRNSRTDQEVIECVQRTYNAQINNVPTPKIYLNSKNEIVSIIFYKNSRYRLSVIEYIDGSNFFDLKRKPTDEELNKIVNIAVNFSKIDYKPNFIYDTWAITSFCNEYEKKKKFLESKYINMIQPIFDKFKKFNYDILPKSFVHGDMMSTNLMIDKNEKIWVIDFSVSNYMARINELVVICDDVALITGNKVESERRINNAFSYWCENVNATKLEKDSFQILFDVANAINVMNSQYEIITGNDSNETMMHLETGIFGLKLFK